MKSIIFYNLYPKNHWKKLTHFLLSNVPHDVIIINVTLDKWDRLFHKKSITRFLNEIPKVTTVYFSENSKYGEVPGFEKMRKNTDLSDFGILTYLHSKGVTKPEKYDNINDWIKLMHYFLIDKFECCKDVFNNNYALYGVNKSGYNADSHYGPFQFSRFHYSGNFVSVNLNMVKDKFNNTPIERDYFGIEGFFGKLCEYNQAYNAHDSGANNIQSHYFEPYPEKLYKK